MKASDPWATGVLKPEYHDRLVANLTQIVQRSGLGPMNRHLIWTSAELNKAELQLCEGAVVATRNGGLWELPRIGICYTQNHAQAEQKMLEMTALLVRNFVDARCMSRADIVAERKANGTVDASVLMVPDFALPEYVETMPNWERAAMMEFVHERVRNQQPTCLFVGVSMDILKMKLPSVHADLHSAFKIEAA